MTKLVLKVNQCAAAAAKHRKLNKEVDDLFEERYGEGNYPSNHDIDWLIDTICYGQVGGVSSLKELDEKMEEEGIYPLKDPRNPMNPNHTNNEGGCDECCS